MSIDGVDKGALESLIRKVLAETLREEGGIGGCPIKSVSLPKIAVSEADRLNTGHADDVVYTHDLFSLAESPRLGAGIMEMKKTTFAWTLDYDEIDYVIEGKLNILYQGTTVSAKAGELILIPKGSQIQFCVPEFARFLYVTYPADWQAK